MLTKRWSILRVALPPGISMVRSIALVNALAKLHNFCIDCRDKVISISPCDHYNLVTNPNGYVPLEDDKSTGLTLPAQIVGGGHHFDDINRMFQQNQSTSDLPRQQLLAQVINAHVVRPRAFTQR